MNFGESYIGQPVSMFIDGIPKIGYITKLIRVETEIDDSVYVNGDKLNIIKDVIVEVDHGDHSIEYSLNELSLVKGNM